MSVMEWNRLRAPQLRALAQEDCLVILPVGSTEQHGPHLPVQVDALLATEVSLGCCFPIQSSWKSYCSSDGLVRACGTSYGSRRDVHPGSFNLSFPDPLPLQIHSTSWLPQDLCRQRPWRQYSCSSCDRCRTQAGTGFEDSGLYLLDPA